MKKAIYITSSVINEHTSGGTTGPSGRRIGGGVPYHELKVLKEVCMVRDVYQYPQETALEQVFPGNPFMQDIHTALNIVNPSEIEIAYFFGGNFPVTMKLLSEVGAKVIVTVNAHNLEVSLKEWTDLAFFEKFNKEFELIHPNQHLSMNSPPTHLTNSEVFNLSCKGYIECADIVITPSTCSANYLHNKFKLNPVVIPHGVNIPPTWTSDRTPFTVLDIAPFAIDKGQKYLVESWRDYCGGIKGELILAGSLGAQLLFSGVTNISHRGVISEEDKNNLYSTASVYVQPSVTEGFGMCVLEAMARGTPVIVTEGVGAKDCVDDGKDGFIVPIRDAKAIADKIRYFHDNPSEVKKFGANARLKAEKYDWPVIEKKYTEVIQNA